MVGPSNSSKLTADATGTFTVQNNNYFSVKFEEPDITLYWLTDGAALLPPCNGGCQVKMGFWGCGVDMGTFQSDEKFTAGTHETLHKQLTLTQNDAQRSCSNQMLENALFGPQGLATRGTIDAKAALRDFGEVHTSTTVYNFA